MKMLVWLLGVVAVIYVIAAVAAWRLLPSKIQDADNRLWGVRAAISRLTKDQWIVSERMRTITSETLGRGRSKIEQVSAIMDDPDLNHIALTYMGADWSLQRSSFLGQVAHARNLLATQREARRNKKSRLDEKIRELEARKRSLSKQMRSPSSDREFVVQMYDVDSQLARFRSSNTYMEYMEKDNAEDKHIEATAQNENALFRLASDYETATVGTLNRVLAEKLGELRWEENEPMRIRRIASVFNVWPLNQVLKLPEGGNEKRL